MHPSLSTEKAMFHPPKNKLSRMILALKLLAPSEARLKMSMNFFFEKFNPQGLKAINTKMVIDQQKNYRI